MFCGVSFFFYYGFLDNYVSKVLLTLQVKGNEAKLPNQTFFVDSPVDTNERLLLCEVPLLFFGWIEVSVLCRFVRISVSNPNCIWTSLRVLTWRCSDILNWNWTLSERDCCHVSILHCANCVEQDWINLCPLANFVRVRCQCELKPHQITASPTALCIDGNWLEAHKIVKLLTYELIFVREGSSSVRSCNFVTTLETRLVNLNGLFRDRLFYDCLSCARSTISLTICLWI